MGSEHYCLRWNNHQNNLLGVFSQLLRDESLVDVTLACSEGHSIRAHKVVLSACSSYFQTLFVDHPSRHPIVILKDVRFSELRTLVDFMYKGEVNVEYCQLSALLKTAESLKVKGLAEMTRDYKQEPGHIVEPPEFARSSSRIPHGPPSPEEHHDLITRGISERERDPSPAPQNLRICKLLPTSTAPEHTDTSSELNRPSSTDNREIISAASSSNNSNRNICSPLSNNDHGPADLVVHNNSSNNNASSISSPIVQQREQQSAICSRLDSPINNEPVPGPSNLPPVQQVPLSLKKEADWGGGMDEKNIGESSSDYSRHPHDSEQHPSGSTTDLSREREGSPRLYPCMYCGVSFPHQSKLTRHILSHSLETLKYREQLQQHAPNLAIPETSNFLETHFGGRIPGGSSHEPPDPAEPTPMDFDLEGAAVSGATSGVVLCKFCGKSFPDVSSLITHLPVHTGDRPFKCEFCGKAFKLRHHMKDHCRVHTGERPFRCALCGKTFSRSTILKAHEKTHYPKYVRKFLSPSPLDTEEESPH